MKKTFIFLCVIIFALSSALISFREINKDEKIFEGLYIIAGSWTMKTGKGMIGEEWRVIDKHYLQSKGFFIKGTDTVITERVALRKRSDGIFYTSTAENQNNHQAVDFKLTSANNGTYIFENPQHDFPKRIVYSFVSNDSLHAWIDDGTGNNENREDFYYSRGK
jgi:hypothetical protein